MSRRSRNRSAAVHIKGSDFSKIKRIWAENGLVRLEQPDGRIIVLKPKDAAMRAQLLNDSIPEMLRAGVKQAIVDNDLRLIGCVAEACREAQRQNATPDKKTKAVQNLLTGCDASGKPLVDGLPEDYWIERFHMRYHTISKDEVMAVVRGMKARGGTMSKAEEVVRVVHRQRLNQLGKGENPAEASIEPVLKAQ